jgi:hypothetical protein
LTAKREQFLEKRNHSAILSRVHQQNLQAKLHAFAGGGRHKTLHFDCLQGQGGFYLK